MENGLLDRRESFDLLDNLDFGIMELGMSDEEPTTNSVTVDPVLMPVGAAHKSGVLGGDQSKVSPPPLPITTATTATAAAEKAASAASSSVSAFRNSGTVEEGTAAQASPVGGGEKNSSQGESGSGIQGSVGAGAAGGGSGVHASEQEIDVRGAAAVLLSCRFPVALGLSFPVPVVVHSLSVCRLMSPLRACPISFLTVRCPAMYYKNYCCDIARQATAI